MLYQQRKPRRRGTVLVLFALILFVLFAFAALVIDLGFAFLTRRQMQTAVDTAALEGLRGYNPGDPATDLPGRTAARNLLQDVFDDDLDPADGDPRNFGAGPLPFSNPPVYKPSDFQLNPANDPAGDMVRGRYLGGTDHVKQSNYSRNDFDPNPTVATDRTALLVRMRRTNETFASGNGQSSAGPPVPYLFGRATLLSPEAKARGISVRATAIAQAQRALSVGTPNPGLAPPLPGGMPFVLFRSAWENAGLIPTDAGTSLTLDGSGTLRIGPMPVGYFISGGPAPATSIGQPATPLGASPTPGQLAGSLSGVGYVPIVPQDGTAVASSVIGFGFVEVAPATLTGAGFQVIKRANRVAAENASAVLAQPLPVLFSDPQTGGANLPRLLQNVQALRDPLLAPALAR